ncbi:glycine cleavage system protein GcvH [Kitasatospora sp. NPDC088548]|uniref:glycine cleavage system protein GcvH n=1 Tax=Kitasatospora sp. NPDC088548 TaxID=3364075 RepID=UPI003812EC50
MTDIPKDLKYSRDHEWVRSTGNGKVRVGLTAFAQRQLGDVVFVELPESGAALDAGEPVGTVESVKAVSEVYTPVSGTIAAVNESLNDSPELINEEPYDQGWIVDVTLSAPKQLDDLLTAAQYGDYIKAESDG